MESLREYRALPRFLMKNHKALFTTYLPNTIELCELLQDSIPDPSNPTYNFVTTATAAGYDADAITAFREAITSLNICDFTTTGTNDEFFIAFAGGFSALNTKTRERSLMAILIAHVEATYADPTLTGLSYTAIIHLYIAYLAAGNVVPTGFASTGLLTLAGIEPAAGAFAFVTETLDTIPGAVSEKFIFLGVPADGYLPEELALGSFELSTGASGSVDSVLVNGVELLSTPVPFNTSLAQTAIDVANNITAFFATSRYTATVTAGIRVLLHPEAGTGATVNGHVVNPTGTTITFANVVNMANGKAATPSKVAGRYVTFSSPSTNYYVWFNGGSDSDPAIGGATGIEVEITPGDSASTVRGNALTAINDALQEVALATLTDIDGQLMVRLLAGGPATNATAGNLSGVSVVYIENGAAGSAYTEELETTNGTAPVTFAVIAGDLPPGISLSSAGEFSGTTTALAGNSFLIVVEATDANENTIQREFLLRT